MYPYQNHPKVWVLRKTRKIISVLREFLKPGLRVHIKTGQLPRVLGGLSVIALISHQPGVITDKEARWGVGGEVLAFVCGGSNLMKLRRYCLFEKDLGIMKHFIYMGA